MRTGVVTENTKLGPFQLSVLGQISLPLYLSEPQFPHQSNWVMLPSPWGCVRVAVMVEKVPAEPCVSVSPHPPPYTTQCRKLGVPTRAPLKAQVPSGCCRFPSLRWASPEVGVGTGGGKVRGGACCSHGQPGQEA